jgi:hypothetical protein
MFLVSGVMEFCFAGEGRVEPSGQGNPPERVQHKTGFRAWRLGLNSGHHGASTGDNSPEESSVGQRLSRRECDG